MDNLQIENMSSGNQLENKGEIDIETENGEPISISKQENDTKIASTENESNEGKTSGNSDSNEADDCDELEGLMISKLIDGTAKARRRQDPEAFDDIEEDAVESERTEIDGNIVVEVDVPESGENRPSNTYAAKKTVAQGMMDIALLTANANQLRYAMELKNSLVVGLIVFSLILQVSIGIAMIFKGRMYLRGKSKDPVTVRVDTIVVSGIFLITVINIFIASFTTTSGDISKKL